MNPTFICPHCRTELPKPEVLRSRKLIVVMDGDGTAPCPHCSSPLVAQNISDGKYDSGAEPDIAIANPDAPISMLGGVLVYGPLIGLFYGAIGHAIVWNVWQYDVHSLGQVLVSGFAAPNYYLYAAGMGALFMLVMGLSGGFKGVKITKTD